MLQDNDTFEHKGRTFRVEFPYDDDAGAPWDREDGHGPVSGFRYHAPGQGSKPPKAPGERILYWGRGAYRTYGFAEAMRIAKRDGWGLSDADTAALAKKLKRTPTRGDIVAEAVERDFEYLRRWCTDQWSYVGVVVRLADEPTRSESLWGIESDAYDYLEETAHELAEQICAELDNGMAQDIAASRPDMQPGFAGA